MSRAKQVVELLISGSQQHGAEKRRNTLHEGTQYSVKDGNNTTFDQLSSGPRGSKRNVTQLVWLKPNGDIVNVSPGDKYVHGQRYALTQHDNYLHLYFDENGKLLGGARYSDNYVDEMVKSLGMVPKPGGSIDDDEE